MIYHVSSYTFRLTCLLEHLIPSVISKHVRIRAYVLTNVSMAMMRLVMELMMK
jgi:hypothetical protein